MFISRHVEKLLLDIKTKAIKQYWVPFSNLSLKQMSEQLDTTVDELQIYLVALIKSNNLDARIDDHLKVLDID